MHGELHADVFFPDAEYYLSDKVTQEDLQIFFKYPVAVDYNTYGHLPERLIAAHLMTPEAQAILDAEGATIGDVFHQRVWPAVYMRVFKLWNKALGKDLFGLVDDEAVAATEEPAVKAPVAPPQKDETEDEEQEQEQEQESETSSAPVQGRRGRKPSADKTAE